MPFVKLYFILNFDVTTMRLVLLNLVLYLEFFSVLLFYWLIIDNVWSSLYGYDVLL